MRICAPISRSTCSRWPTEEARMSTESYTHIALPGSPGSPLLFLFHGTGGDEEQLVSFGRELLPGAGIVSPR